MGGVACGGDADPQVATEGAGDATSPDPTTEGQASATDSTIDEPDEVVLAGACESAVRLGGFLVDAGAAQTSVSGDAADVVNPVASLQEVMADDTCRLLRPIQPFCDPPCGGGELCSPEEVCITAPLRQDLGIVSISGLVNDVEMEPVQPGNNYFDTSLPHPGFVPGEVVHLASTEGFYGELSLYGIGSEQLTLGPDLVIPEADPLQVTWDAPAGPSYGTLYFSLNIDQHGMTPVQVVCEFEDTGSGQVSAAMIAGLRDAGISGFPNTTLSRRTVDSVEVTGGCIDFVVTSRLKVPTSVAGHTPCMFATQCPDGQTCSIETQTCVAK